MTAKWALAGLAVFGLAACDPAPIADSAADPLGGVGFGHYETYLQERAAREAQLTGRAPAHAEATGAPPAFGSPPASGGPAAAGSAAPAPTAADLAAAGIGVTARQTASAPQDTGRAPLETAAVTAAPLDATGTGRQATGSRATEAGAVGAGAAGAATAVSRTSEVGPSGSGAAVIERDTAPPAQAAAQAPAPQGTARPAQSPAAMAEATAARDGRAEGPDIVAYALGTSHPVGKPLYRRMLPSPARAARLCARFAGADLAQRAFLDAGGPERDRLGLDPDGDGYVCGWNPAPFRAARG